MTDIRFTDTEPPCTDLGSPCSRAWDEDGVAIVNAAEHQLEHPICGAHTMAGTPISLALTTVNGYE